MNWISKLFSDKSADSNSPNASIAVAEQVVNASIPEDFANVDKPISRTEQNLDIAELKKFIPLRDLDESILVTLPHAKLRYKKDSVLFNLDQRSESIFYLLKGSLHMQPAGAYGYVIDENTVRSRMPLNTGRYYGATAQAVTDVEVVEIPSEFNSLWVDQHRSDDDFLQLSDIQLPANIAEREFFDSCARAYQYNELTVPSLPEIALKLNKAMQSDIAIKDVVEIIQLDPGIVIKLIQVANSPIYATAIPITNCKDAVARIGLNATRNLVLSICMKHLFRTKNPQLMKAMRQLWKNCVFLSSLCFVLAQECDDVQPEDALLAGLIADIGTIPILQFADQYSKPLPSIEEIYEALPYFRGPVGAMVLGDLEFSQELCNIPQLAENWLYDSGAKTTVADIVILAKLHSYFGSGKAMDLPYINTIPAYSKLHDGKLNPDFSLTVILDAQNRIRAAMQLLS